MWCGASARASSSSVAASSTSRNELPALRVEHDRQQHARVLGLGAGRGDEHRLARIAARLRPDSTVSPLDTSTFTILSSQPDSPQPTPQA